MAGQLHEWNTCVDFFSFLKILVNILSSNSKGKSLNLDKMDKFLKRYNHPRLNHKETEENMNRLVIGNETELIILKHQHNKSPRPYCFTGKFWNYSKELQRKEHIWTHFMRPPSPWYQKQKKRYHKKEDYQALSWMNIDAKILSTILAEWLQQYIEIIHRDQMGHIPGMQGLLNIGKSISVIHHISK